MQEVLCDCFRAVSPDVSLRHCHDGVAATASVCQHLLALKTLPRHPKPEERYLVKSRQFQASYRVS